MKLTVGILILFFLLPLHLTAKVVFTQNCRAIGDDYLQFSIESDENVFKKNSAFALKITAFEDEDCKTAYLQFNQYFTIDHINPEFINLRTEKVTYTALSEEVSQALRSISYCDISDWQFKVETEATGRLCDEYRQLSKDDFFYQIIKINKDSLQFGATTKDLDGRSFQKRPVQFDPLKYSIR